MLWWLLLLAAAIQTVKTDQPLRSGCEAEAPVVATVKAGDPVQVKFSLAGGAKPCFLVSATINGKAVDGYLPGEALTGLADFERARREAAPVVSTGQAAPPAPPKTPLAGGIPVVPHPDFLKASELLEKNQPGEALALLERLVQQYPGRPELLLMAGHAAYRADRLGDARDFLRRSLEARADPRASQLLETIERETVNDRSREKKYGMRFLLRYDGAVATPDMAQAIVELLESQWAQVQARLGCRADERIVTIVQTAEAFRSITGTAEWTAGAYDGKIRIPLVDRRQITEETRRTFTHEIVHACLANLGHWPMWMHEGVAQKLSGEIPPAAALHKVETLGKDGKLPKLDQLNSSWVRLGWEQASLSYAIAYYAADQFIARYGEAGLRNLVNNPESLPRITAELDRRIAGKE